MQLTNHFHSREFNCPCCDKERMDKDFIETLEACRILAGVPFVITSGYRCEEHNEKIGGHPSSAHSKGLAVDISYKNGACGRKIVDAASKCNFEGIEVGTRHIHLDDTCRSHGEKVLWTAVSK